jgi:GH24 family phage-related lysozyme (muramidase)
MQVSYYDPDQRALEKAESRRRDEEALISGRISLEELQRVNGGYGMFRSSKLMRRLKGVKAADWRLAPAV